MFTCDVAWFAPCPLPPELTENRANANLHLGTALLVNVDIITWRLNVLYRHDSSV